MTPRTIIIRALRKAGVNGVGQSANTDDLNDAFDDLNDMLGQWARRRWLVPHLIEVVFGPSGKPFYTIGPGLTNDIITPRPDRIEAAFVRYSQYGTNPADYPLDVLDSREDYNQVKLKSWASVPVALFYDSGYPNGSIYLWPNQAATGTADIHLTLKSNDLASIATLDTVIALPPEYAEAILYNLSARLRPSYQLPPDPTMTALAVSSLATIRKSNAQIPRSLMPPGMPGMHRRGAGLGGLLGGSTGAGPGAFLMDISLLDGGDVVA